MENETMPAWEKGDRVVLTDEAVRAGLHGRGDIPCHGTVVGWTRDGKLVKVRRDHCETAESYAPDWWMPAAEADDG